MAKIALLIGVSEYEPGLSPLPATMKDIEAMKRVLENPEMGGFDVVKTLANPEPQTMLYEIEMLFNGRIKKDFVLLYFSGHGIKDEFGKLYFASRITRKHDQGNLIKSTTVPASSVHEVMNNCLAKRQVIILDCCFSGAFDNSLQAKDDGSINLQTQLGAEGRVVLTSSSSSGYSFEDKESEFSIYTKYLVEGIETGAGDANSDGNITMEELHKYAERKVKETAPNMTPKIIMIKDMGYDIILAKSKVIDPELNYRRQVEKYSSQGSISSTSRKTLDAIRFKLELSPERAREIEVEVLRPYQERLHKLRLYKQEFLKIIKHEYPLNSHTKSDLEGYRETLGLRRQDVATIEEEIIKEVITSKAKNSPSVPSNKPQKTDPSSLNNRSTSNYKKINLVGIFVVLISGAMGLLAYLNKIPKNLFRNDVPPSPTSTPNTNPDSSPAPKKPFVREAKTILKELGFYTGEIDDYQDSAFTKVIKNFQQSENMKADGILGPKTIERLQASLRSPSPPISIPSPRQQTPLPTLSPQPSSENDNRDRVMCLAWEEQLTRSYTKWVAELMKQDNCARLGIPVPVSPTRSDPSPPTPLPTPVDSMPTPSLEPIPIPSIPEPELSSMPSPMPLPT